MTRPETDRASEGRSGTATTVTNPDADADRSEGEGANGATGGVGEEDGVGGGFFGEREGVFSRVSRAFGGDSNAATDGVVRGGVVDHARAV